MGVIAAFVLFAHTMLEPPQQIYGTWAHNQSTNALFTPWIPSTYNLLNVESPSLGLLAASLSVVLTALVLIAFAVAVRDSKARDI